jgi:ketosteroid isomerase-like protein
MLLLAACACLAAAPASASDKSDVLAAAKAYDDAINKGDGAAQAAACAPGATIVDDFPPYFWPGPTACADWFASAGASAAQAGLTDLAVLLGRPRQVTVVGDRAYVVAPSRFSYKAHGKPTVEAGVWTMVLQKIGADWKIASWAWAQM